MTALAEGYIRRLRGDWLFRRLLSSVQLRPIKYSRGGATNRYISFVRTRVALVVVAVVVVVVFVVAVVAAVAHDYH